MALGYANNFCVRVLWQEVAVKLLEQGRGFKVHVDFIY